MENTLFYRSRLCRGLQLFLNKLYLTQNQLVSNRIKWFTQTEVLRIFLRTASLLGGKLTVLTTIHSNLSNTDTEETERVSVLERCPHKLNYFDDVTFHNFYDSNTPFYRYGGHTELIRFKEYYKMPQGAWAHFVCIFERFSGQFFEKLS